MHGIIYPTCHLFEKCRSPLLCSMKYLLHSKALIFFISPKLIGVFVSESLAQDKESEVYFQLLRSTCTSNGESESQEHRVWLQDSVFAPRSHSRQLRESRLRKNARSIGTLFIF